MNEDGERASNAKTELSFDLGTFEGFTFRDQCPIWGNRSASEVIAWNHDLKGEAEFWVSGDRPEVRLVFTGVVTGWQLSALALLLDELGGDTEENFLRIRFALDWCGDDITKLTSAQVEESSPQIFFGDCFTEARKEAAYELFEVYYPELYRLFDASCCDGLIFDAERFLDSPAWRVDEVRISENRVALLVAPQ